METKVTESALYKRSVRLKTVNSAHFKKKSLIFRRGLIGGLLGG